jgi:hypothetical protein
MASQVFFFLDNHQEYIKKVIKLIVKVKYRKKKEQILKNKNKIDLLQKKKKSMASKVYFFTNRQ